MAVEDVLARVSEIEALAARFSLPVASSPSAAPFAAALGRAEGAVSAAGGGGSSLRMLAVATGELGVVEEPPGSNAGTRIGVYREADGSQQGVPWCATFVSWAARQAGAPLGEEGEGYAAVEDVEAWGRRTGRFLPAGSEPRPGDIVLFGGRHVGLVEQVGPGGSLVTIEGNHENRVARVERDRSEPTGYVRI